MYGCSVNFINHKSSVWISHATCISVKALLTGTDSDTYYYVLGIRSYSTYNTYNLVGTTRTIDVGESKVGRRDI